MRFRDSDEPEFKITLKAARLNREMTLDEASKLFDISYTTLRNYEINSTDVPLSFYMKVDEVYRIPRKYIFFGKIEDHLKELNKTPEQKPVSPLAAMRF